ncbi:MAG: hypothetical protein A2008_08385 [Candidatus Wallbacteria bacterium GWC2_49_35]|uniref:Hcy-binding domain-containing protein n=1 Tax=Candidatus Wallbacteria bacterium GWC2_49_35 TaxID=1817813 RepID=A0A1F7WLC5_9BACT|nr:MAG: hypothetical protein A2008_08385 [Candidatus Wallbacteria bacterium GWC2_49_35]
MNLSQLISENKLLFTEGAVVERVRREIGVEMNDGGLLNAALVYEERGREILEKIYRQYLDIGKSNGMPMLIFTPTWRANKDRIAGSPYKSRDVNADCFRFMDGIRRSYGDYGNKIFIGGLTGCKGDAYRPSEGLEAGEAYEFHKSQTAALASAGVDFLIAETLPALPEAIGISLAMAATAKTYALSFVIRADGCLLDGNSLNASIAEIDSAVDPKPLFYMVNCVHPSVLASTLTAEINRSDTLRRRLIGIQANTSSLSPEELDQNCTLQSDDENKFYEFITKLHFQHGMKIFGGCCGTTDRHIKKIVDILKR